MIRTDGGFLLTFDECPRSASLVEHHLLQPMNDVSAYTTPAARHQTPVTRHHQTTGSGVSSLQCDEDAQHFAANTRGSSFS